MQNTNSEMLVEKIRFFFLSFIGFAIVAVSVCCSKGVSQLVPQNSEPLDQTNTHRLLESGMQEDNLVIYEGTQFLYDTVLADKVMPETVAAHVPEDPTFRPDGFEPKHITFRFKGAYASEHEKSSFKPEISVYLISDYKKILRPSPDYAKLVERKFQLLRSIISEEPSKLEGEYPFIPFVDATQIIRSNKSYINFKNGKGISYLTQFNHGDPSLIANGKLVYVFQGITGDGKYFVSATFPIRASFIPDDPAATSSMGYTMPNDFYKREERSTNETEYNQYLTRIEAKLSSTPDDALHPSLSKLKKLLSSLEIRPSGSK